MLWIALANRPAAVTTLMDDCLALMRPVAQERHIRLDVHAAVPCDCFVAADRTRLKQVLLNLLSNAIKYNHDGGLVLLACVADSAGDGSAVRLSVRDSGPGLSPDQRERLFNAFDRLGADAGPIEGAGIGLVLSKRMVELMHGRIGVDSQPGVGSTFWVCLPAAPPPLPATDRDHPHEMTVPGALSEHSTSTVLYIEDNPVNLLLMEAMLEHEPGVRLITAQDPLLGITLARTERPQLILLDIQLPGIDGFEVLRRLRGAAATRDTPVIAISANAMHSDIQQGLDAGFDDYLTKPLDLTRLRARVRRALRC
jgi:CheY-like chemotaxis protein